MKIHNVQKKITVKDEQIKIEMELLLLLFACFRWPGYAERE